MYSAGQLAGPRTIGQLLLLKTERSQTNGVRRATADAPPKNLLKLRPWLSSAIVNFRFCKLKLHKDLRNYFLFRARILYLSILRA